MSKYQRGGQLPNEELSDLRASLGLYLDPATGAIRPITTERERSSLLTRAQVDARARRFVALAKQAGVQYDSIRTAQKG